MKEISEKNKKDAETIKEIFKFAKSKQRNIGDVLYSLDVDVYDEQEVYDLLSEYSTTRIMMETIDAIKENPEIEPTPQILAVRILSVHNDVFYIEDEDNRLMVALPK